MKKRAGIGSAFCIFARRISRPKQDRCLARSRKGSVVFWRMSLRRAIIGKSSSGSPAYAARRNDCSSLSMKPGLNRCINKRFASRRSVKPTASDVTLGNPAGGEEPPPVRQPGVNSLRCCAGTSRPASPSSVRLTSLVSPEGMKIVVETSSLTKPFSLSISFAVTVTSPSAPSFWITALTL